MNYPTVSIILINYNGKHFLSPCIDSILKCEYPRKRLEIVVVDNNSIDMSVDFLLRNYPDVKVVKSNTNLGFAGGANLGVKSAMGRYIVLLNTDTIVEKEWLINLVTSITSKPHLAAVNSKSYLYYPLVEFKIKSDIFNRSEFTNTINFQSVGVLIENVLLKEKKLQSLVRYRSGFYKDEKGPIPARWTQGDASILVPIDTDAEETQITFTIRSEKSATNLETKISIQLGDKVMVEDRLKSYEIKQYGVTLKNSDIKGHLLYAVQNAGNYVFRSGHSRDGGAVVKDNNSFYEIDCDFYNHYREIQAFCGVSVIISKTIFQQLGGFDEKYFMYYEDIDLSLQMRRNGYKIGFEPTSILRHIHAGSSVEWSPFFVYNVEKNHLATLLKHFPLKIFVREYIIYLLITLVSAARTLKWRFKEHWELYEHWKDRTMCRFQVLRWVLSNIFPMLVKRYKISKNATVSMSQIYKSLY